MTLERSRGEKTAMLGPAQCSVDRTEDDRAAEERDLPMQGENNAAGYRVR